jgi:hypothetical protein
MDLLRSSFETYVGKTIRPLALLLSTASLTSTALNISGSSAPKRWFNTASLRKDRDTVSQKLVAIYLGPLKGPH